MSLDKDIEKMTDKLKGTKRRYRIEPGNYGGEMVVGEVSEEFVDYWIDRESYDLMEQVLNTGEGAEEDENPDDNSPEVKEDFTYWHDCDEYEHLNGAFSDGEWTVYEVPADGSDDWDWDNEIWNGDANHIYGRECYFDNSTPDDMEDYVPVLSFMSVEKGNFGVCFLDLEGEEFDPEKLRFGSCESNLADLVESVYYDKEELELNFDYADTNGKSYEVQVGYMNTKWRDDPNQYTVEYLEEEGYFD